MLPVAVEQDECAPGVSWTNWRGADLEENMASTMNRSPAFGGDEPQVGATAQRLERALCEVLIRMAQDGVQASPT